MSVRAFTHKHKQKRLNELAARPVLQPKAVPVDTEQPEMLPRKKTASSLQAVCVYSWYLLLFFLNNQIFLLLQLTLKATNFLHMLASSLCLIIAMISACVLVKRSGERGVAEARGTHCVSWQSWLSFHPHDSRLTLKAMKKKRKQSLFCFPALVLLNISSAPNKTQTFCYPTSQFSN